MPIKCPDCGYVADSEEFQMDTSDIVEELFNDCVLEVVDDGLPCYVQMVRDVQNLPDDLSVSDFLEEYFRYESGSLHLGLFSVTSLEPRYQEWLDCAEGYPGAHVIPVQRQGRTCFFIAIPREPAL